jgi:hypothetical protein
LSACGFTVALAVMAVVTTVVKSELMVLSAWVEPAPISPGFTVAPLAEPPCGIGGAPAGNDCAVATDMLKRHTMHAKLISRT